MPRPGALRRKRRQARIAPEANARCPACRSVAAIIISLFSRRRLCIDIMERDGKRYRSHARQETIAMTSIFAAQALTARRLARQCAADDRGGTHRRRRAGRRRRRPATSATRSLLPGMPNLHSHAFQRGMAGLAEMRGPSRRQFLDLARGDVPLRADDDTRIRSRRSPPSSMSRCWRPASRASASSTICTTTATASPMPTSPKWPTRIAAAAGETGIGLTLLPVFYAHAAFGGAAAERRPAALHQRCRRLRAACSRAAARHVRTLESAPSSASRRTACARSTPEELRRRLPRWRRTGRSTSTSPSRSRRSRTASPGPARGRSNGCSTNAAGRSSAGA